MENRKSMWARLTIGIGLLIVLAPAVPVSAQDAPPLFTSGIFRASIPGVKTKTALWVPDTEFFEAKTGTIATMGKNGYTLTDLDIDTSTGQRYYSAIFKSGEASTQYWELAPEDFFAKVALLALKKIYLISLHTYFSPENGELFYSGIFQPGTGPQIFSGSGGLNYQEFQSMVESLAKEGYFLTNMAVYREGGQDYYVGAFRGGLAQGHTQYNLYEGDWDSMASEIFVSAANGMRLVSLSDDGQGNYAGAWIAGRDPFEVVAATTGDVFNNKTAELKTAGLSPVRILIEKAYKPPIGLGLAFYNLMDGSSTGGYSYSVSEKGSLTATGGAGVARSSWDPEPNTPMTADTRLEIASVTKFITGVAAYKVIEDSNGAVTLNTTLKQVIGPGLFNWSTAGKYVDQLTIGDLLNMASGIFEGSCGVAPNYYSANLYTNCALQNCPRQYPQSASGACTPPGMTHICGPSNPSPTGNCYHYSDPDFGILKVVIEQITHEDFETYLHDTLFVPLGINDAAYSATDIRNANCHPDLVTPTKPLYYNASQTSGPGVYDEEYYQYQSSPYILISPTLSTERSVTVCGTGGMQMTAAQAAKFWNGLMHGKLIKSSDLNKLLNDWFINTSGAMTWSGQGYDKDGGYTVYNNQGVTSNVVVEPNIDTQVTLFTNIEGNTLAGVGIDPGGAIVDGLDWMGFHPVDTVSVVNQNSAAFGPMCFNVSGGGAAQNTAIIQWTCGPKPLPLNELFTKVDSVSGDGTFMLQAPQTLWTATPMCITSEYDNTSANDQMILYGCNGLSNQMFKLGAPNSKGFSNIVVQVSKKCLTVDQNSIYSGANIVQDACVAGESSQEWAVQSATAQ